MNELGMVDGIDRKEQCSGELDVTASGQSVGAADSTSERRNENAIGGSYSSIPDDECSYLPRR